MRGDHHVRGALLVAGSAVAYSTAGFFTKLIPLDPWTILFWRGLFAGAFVAGWFFAMEGRNSLAAMRAIGWPGVVATICSGVATILFINAFRLTSVADVVILFATAPFVTAAIARVCYGTRVDGATLVASLAVLLGVAVMFGGAAGQGHLAGDLLGMGMTVLMSVVMVIFREHRDTPMLPASFMSALLCSLLVAPVSAPAAVNWSDAWLLIAFGVGQLGLGLLTLTLGARLISATESALISTVEVPLAAFWVWLAFGEVPAWATVAGGTVVLAAVVWHVARDALERFQADYAA